MGKKKKEIHGSISTSALASIYIMWSSVKDLRPKHTPSIAWVFNSLIAVHERNHKQGVNPDPAFTSWLCLRDFVPRFPIPWNNAWLGALS